MELRVAFDNLAASNGDTTPYQLTVRVLFALVPR